MIKKCIENTKIIVNEIYDNLLNVIHQGVKTREGILLRLCTSTLMKHDIRSLKVSQIIFFLFECKRVHMYLTIST